MADSRTELVHMAVAGDADALSELLKLHGPSVERTLQISDIHRSMIDPSDVMQVTYLEAFLRIGSFDPSRAEGFEAWLRQIARNNLLDAIRGLERQKQPPPRHRVTLAGGDDSMVGLYDFLGAGTSATPSRAVQKKELIFHLQRAMEALPERYARVVRLYDLEGRSIGEVAEALGKSPGAVHMLRARAHDRLRERIGSPAQFFSTHA